MNQTTRTPLEERAIQWLTIAVFVLIVAFCAGLGAIVLLAIARWLL